MSYDWGPYYIVPSEVLKSYSGSVRLREKLDEELLRKDLETLGLPQHVTRIVNPWYYRKKDTGTWIKIGQSDDKSENFPVSWDTTRVKNGRYEVLGLMHVIVKSAEEETTVVRQNVVEVTVEN